MTYTTEQLIEQVKIRTILWNSKSQHYLAKERRIKAWDEIGEVFHPEWKNLKPAERKEKVARIVKKWRNVRDYYMKEKKRTASSKSPVMKKKYSYYDCLTFLDTVIKQKWQVKDNSGHEINDYIEEEMNEEYLNSDDSQRNVVISYEHPVCTQEDDSNDSSSTAASSRRNIKQEKVEASTSKTRVSFKTHAATPSDRTQEDHVKANKNFLLSLLPDVTSLDAQQNMRFRLGVLNLIQDIKFDQR